MGLEYSGDINPGTGEPYDPAQWSSTIAANRTALTRDWSAHMGADSVLDYLTKNNKLVVSPGNAYQMPDDASDIQNKRGKCGAVLKTASWQMMFAPTQAQFDSIWADAKKRMDTLGYQDVLKEDVAAASGFRAAIVESIKDAGTR